MEDYLHPLKVVKDKIRGLTGFTCDDVLTDLKDAFSPVSYNESLILARCSKVGLKPENLKFIEPYQLVTEAELRITKDPLLTSIPRPKAIKENSSSETLKAKECSYIKGIHQATDSTVGATLKLLEAVLDGTVLNGIVLSHLSDRLGGQDSKLFIESVVLTVRKTLLERNEVNKVLIVAWDVPHGVDEQQPFYEDPRVLYASIKETNETGASALEVGEKLGQGYNINVSYGSKRLSDADGLAILHHLLLPMAYEYNPDLVLILGVSEKLEITVPYGNAPRMEREQTDVMNHDGYLSEAAILTLRALMGQPCPSLLSGGAASQNVHKMILDVLNAQRPYWKCLRFQETKEIQSPIESSSCDGKLPPLLKESIPKSTAKIVKPLHAQSDRVALIYDERMLAHYSYTVPHHLERPERMKSIYHRMLDYELVDRCQRIEAQMATKEQIVMLHEPSYVDLMSRVQSDEELKPHVMLGESDYMACCPDTYELSLLAAGSSIKVSYVAHLETYLKTCAKLVDAILDGEVSSGIAVIRPPGHHAETGAACGFCVFNNTALAAKHAIEQRNLSRVLIVDWDIHHGNGLQRMFIEDPRVLYISMHVFNDYPMLPEIMGSNIVGEGAGMGFNVNIPWSQTEMGDPEYLAAFFDVILPLAYEFQPELVLVACGFDGARGDPIGRCNISPETYGHFANFLKPLANGRLALMLEGGYSLESVSYGMTMIAKALLGDPLPRLRLMGVPHPGAREDIRKVKKAHEPYWRCLQYEVPASVSSYIERGKPTEPRTLNWCPDLDCLMPFDPHPNNGVGYAKLCSICDFFMPNSSCLTCYKTFCIPNGYDGHSRQHYVETGHTLALNSANLEIWCHKCENYVNHPVFDSVNQRALWERYGENPCSYPKLAA